MDVRGALDQIAEIHERLSRAEVYRGYRAVSWALSGGIALAAAAAQSYLVDSAAGNRGFVLYWTGVAAVAGPAASIDTLRRVAPWSRTDAHERRKALTVLWQFLPCLFAGVLVTAPAYVLAPGTIACLPGLWAILFGLGFFSSRPYLPGAIGFVGLFYCAAGSILLTLAPHGASLNPWGMGLTFGLGQMACAAVLYWNLERRNDKEDRR